MWPPRYLAAPMKAAHLRRTGLSFLASVSVIATMNAQLAGPESVEYDPVGDRYFVSNTQSGMIKVLDQVGTITDFATVSPAPYGLEIMDGVLYACSGGRVKGYDLDDASMVFDRDLNGTFLNGITTDGAFLYVTDFSAGRIYKVDPAANAHSTLVAATQGTPNGIVHRPGTDELLVAYWGSNAHVRSFDRNTGAPLADVGTSLTNIDGIAIDCLGRVLLASWSPDRITAFNWGAGSPNFTDLLVTGLNNPADIDFDEVGHRVCIPNTATDTVVLWPINDCPLEVPEGRTYTARVHPNPTDGLVRFDPPFTTAEPFLVVDAQGRIQAMGTLRPLATLDLGALPAGPYVILFSRAAQQVRVMKR